MAERIPFLIVPGRALLSLIFVVSGISKILTWTSTTAWMASKGIPLPSFFAAMAALLEIGAGLALLFGHGIRLASFLLFIYLIPTTLIFHGFWNAGGIERSNQLAHFLKNIALMGSLLLVAGTPEEILGAKIEREPLPISKIRPRRAA